MEWSHDKLDTSKSSLFDGLQGLMIKVPYIMEALDIIQAPSITRTNDTANRLDLLDLLRSCFQINAQLLTWYRVLQFQVNGELYTVAPAVAQNPADDRILGRVFSFAIHFQSLSLAQLILLYWSTMILLYRIIGDIQKLLREYYSITAQNKSKKDVFPKSAMGQAAEEWSYHGPHSGGLPHLAQSPLLYPLLESTARFAANICQSVEYCYRSENGTLGLQSTVFPIWAAKDFYASQPSLHREFQWCSEIGNMRAPDSRFDLKVMKL